MHFKTSFKYVKVLSSGVAHTHKSKSVLTEKVYFSFLLSSSFFTLAANLLSSLHFTYRLFRSNTFTMSSSLKMNFCKKRFTKKLLSIIFSSFWANYLNRNITISTQFSCFDIIYWEYKSFLLKTTWFSIIVETKNPLSVNIMLTFHMFKRKHWSYI